MHQDKGSIKGVNRLTVTTNPRVPQTVKVVMSEGAMHLVVCTMCGRARHFLAKRTSMQCITRCAGARHMVTDSEQRLPAAKLLHECLA